MRMREKQGYQPIPMLPESRTPGACRCRIRRCHSSKWSAGSEIEKMVSPETWRDLGDVAR